MIKVTRNIKAAVCGRDQYMDATEIPDEGSYHLILVYAPNAEGLLDTVYSLTTASGKQKASVPIRLLNEPCCQSALLELKSMVRRITNALPADSGVAVNT